MYNYWCTYMRISLEMDVHCPVFEVRSLLDYKIIFVVFRRKKNMKFFTYGNTGKQNSWLFWLSIAFCLGSLSVVVLISSVDIGRQLLQQSSTV